MWRIQARHGGVALFSGRIIRNMKWSYISHACEMLFGLLLVSYSVRQFGTSLYGLYTLAFSLAPLLDLFDFGLFGLLLQGYVSACVANGAQGLQPLVNAAFRIAWVLGAMAFGAMLCLAMLLPGPFVVPEGMTPITANLFMMSGLLVQLRMPARCLELVFESLDRFDILSRWQMAISICRTVVALAIVYFGCSIVWLAMTQVIAAAIRLIGLWLVLPGHTGVQLNGPNDWHHLFRIWKPGAWVILHSVAVTIGMSTDAPLLGAFASPGAVAVYAIAARIPVHLTAILNKTAGAAFPSLSRFFANRERAALRRLSKQLSYATFLALAPMALAGIVFAHSIMEILLGHRDGSAAWTFRWLLATLVASTVSTPATYLLYACGRVKGLAIATAVESVTNAMVSVLVVRPYGAPGVAFATLLTHVCAALFCYVPLAMRATVMGPEERKTARA